MDYLSKYALKNGTYLRQGKYKIKETISKGNFSIVYKADQHYETGDKQKYLDVIIKEYCPEEYLSEIEAGVEGKMTRRTSANEFVFSSDDDKIEFQKKLDNFNEHKIAVEIKSRSMLERVIDCFTENNTVYIVMEDKGADTLEERINNGRISPNECIEFILNLLNAVKQLHADGYCHGDLKPTNILLHSETTVDGTYDKIALIDFGAVRKFNDTLLEYTKHYSPTWDELEKMTGDKHDYYSIGVILYETICGISHTRIPLSNYSRKDIRDDINKSIHRKGFSSRNNEYVNWIAEAIYRLVAIPSRVTNLDEIRDLLIDNKSEIDKDIVKRRVIKKRHFFYVAVFMLLLFMGGYAIGILGTGKDITPAKVAEAEEDLITVIDDESEIADTQDLTSDELVKEATVTDEDTLSDNEMLTDEESNDALSIAEPVVNETPESDVEIAEEPILEVVKEEEPITEVVKEEPVPVGTSAQEPSTSELAEEEIVEEETSEEEFELVIGALEDQDDDVSSYVVFEAYPMTYRLSKLDELTVFSSSPDLIKEVSISYNNYVYKFEVEEIDFFMDLIDVVHPKEMGNGIVTIDATDMTGKEKSVQITIIKDVSPESQIVKFIDDKENDFMAPTVTLMYIYDGDEIVVENPSSLSIKDLNKYTLKISDLDGLGNSHVFIGDEELIELVVLHNMQIDYELSDVKNSGKVVPGDTLSVLVEDVYGNADEWSIQLTE